jgi:hypothetical protein
MIAMGDLVKSLSNGKRTWIVMALLTATTDAPRSDMVILYLQNDCNV